MGIEAAWEGRGGRAERGPLTRRATAEATGERPATGRCESLSPAPAAELFSYRFKRGGEGGEDKTEGRVGVRSDHRPKHHKQPRRRGGKPGSGTGSGAIFTEGLYCEAVIREAAGRVGVPMPKQWLCVGHLAPVYR